MTPGLVELGKKADEIHREMGHQLAEVVDLLLLIKNSATLKIQEGLLEVGYSAEKIKIFPSALEAHKALSSLLKKGDVMVFQNDWTDNYQ
ncbi:MAG: hypothetical protein LBG59_09655 [Candidatus Peribacteria bacterium]|nr:hypothetical protein [Candidatus Peribacteria bacterium]